MPLFGAIERSLEKAFYELHHGVHPNEKVIPLIKKMTGIVICDKCGKRRHEAHPLFCVQRSLEAYMERRDETIREILEEHPELKKEVFRLLLGGKDGSVS